MKHALLFSVAIALAVVGFLIFQSSDQERISPPSITKSSGEVQLKAKPKAADTIKDVDKQPINEMETVLGLSVRQDRDCTLYEVPILELDGETSVAYRCDPNLPKEQHPYADYSIEELRELAYRDADASEILAIKLIQNGEEGEGLQFVYRSVALGGGESMRALKRAHNTFYSSTLTSEAPDFDPKPAFGDMERSYVFARISEELTGVEQSASVRNELETYGFSDFVRLEKEAREALEQMANVEIEVVGSSSIKEKIDA